MAKVIVYGASDDLIEVEGDLREEFYASWKGNYLHFSDGTILEISYSDEGCWVISCESKGSAQYEHVPHDNEVTTYSDKVTLTGDITWCAIRKKNYG